MSQASMPPEPSQGQGPANPVLVRERRGRLVESLHRGAFAVVSSRGEVVAAAGETARAVFPRSAIKLIQALPLIESGAVAAFGLGAREIALACASHSGEPRHVTAVRDWLERIGCAESDLVCGPHMPSNAAAAEALVREGRAPSRAHNNCSGKHAGFLSVARHLGAPTKGYDRLDHPVQLAVRAALAEMSGIGARSFAVGIDGCGAPNFALPLAALATGFARIADPAALSPARQAAIARIKESIRAEPLYFAGTGRLCTRIVEETLGAIAKVGAEGVYVAALPVQKLGLAIKIDDGSRAAAECVLVSLLVALRALAPDSPLVADFAVPPILNTQGRVAATRAPALETLAPALAAFDWKSLDAIAARAPEVELP